VTDRPTAPELIEAVREFLELEILPTLEDHRFKFRTLVAMNALVIAEREITASEAAVSDEELLALARRIRDGDVPEGVLGRLKEHVAAKLESASPRCLERYEE
jgi:hypothetical protein